MDHGSRTTHRPVNGLKQSHCWVIMGPMKYSTAAISSVLIPFSLALGCSSSQGGEGQECYGNGTCDAGLTCAKKSNMCVDLEEDGSGGSSGSDGSGGGDNGSGGANVGEILEACFSCGEDECEDAASDCDDADGCKDALECWLECAGDTSCTNACDVSDLNEDGVTALSAYFGCVSESCLDECVSAFTEDGTGGTSGTGGQSGGTGGDGSGGEGGDDGSGGNDGTGGSAPVEGELVINGDFSQGKVYWNLDLNAGTSGTYSDDGALCVNNEGYDYLSFSLGFPSSPTDAFTLEGGVAYAFSFDLRGFAEVEAKVGLAVTPYTEIESNVVNSNGPDYQTRSYLVSTAATTEDVGLVFNVTIDSYSYVCFDNVSFAPN